MKRSLSLLLALAATSVPAWMASRALARSIDAGIRAALSADPDEVA